MHRCAAFLFILLDIIAELRVHERVRTLATALLKIFCPEKLFVHAIAEKLLTDMLEIRHAFCADGFLGFWKHDCFQLFICHSGIEWPMDFLFLSALLDLDDSFLGYIAGMDDIVRFQLIAEQPQYLTVLGHLVTSLHNDLHGIVHEIIIRAVPKRPEQWFPVTGFRVSTTAESRFPPHRS